MAGLVWVAPRCNKDAIKMQRLLGFDGERSGDHSDEFVLHSKKPLEIKNIYCYFKSMCMPVGLCTCVEVPQVPTEARSKSRLELE